jgi:hypothetical protein
MSDSSYDAVYGVLGFMGMIFSIASAILISWFFIFFLIPSFALFNEYRKW